MRETFLCVFNFDIHNFENRILNNLTLELIFYIIYIYIVYCV